jgi:hypothetical protein
MSDAVISDSIYVKHSKGKFGSGSTSRESVLETFWFPYKSEDGYVELLLVSENLEKVFGIKERVPVQQFQKEYEVRDNSSEIYLNLKKSLG